MHDKGNVTQLHAYITWYTSKNILFFNTRTYKFLSVCKQVDFKKGHNYIKMKKKIHK